MSDHERHQTTETDEDRIAEIRQITQQEAQLRARKLELIPKVFPEKRGEPKVRGRLNEVSDASGWTREYVARIRDGLVTE